MFSNLVRDDANVISNDKDGGSTTLKDIKVILPTRFEKLGFCTINQDVELLAIIAILHGDNKFKLISYPILIKITPNRIDQVTYDGSDYYVMHIAKGEKFARRNIVKPDNVVKPLIEETIMKGNIPFYLSYLEYRDIFESLHRYVGVGIADDPTIFSIFVSINARDANNLNLHLRHATKPVKKIKWVGLNNVSLSRTDAFSQLTGANMKDGLVAAALKEQDRTDLEKLYD